jgi:hypothetical protein
MLTVHIDTSRKRLKALKDLATTLDNLDAKIGDNGLKSLVALDSNATELQEVPATLLAMNSSSDPLVVGDAKWRALWRSAHDYAASERAIFPPLVDAIDAHCPLCQQLLDLDARHRLVRFEEHDIPDSDIALEKARKARKEVFAGIAQLMSEARVVSQYLDFILDGEAELEPSVRSFLDATFARAEVLISTPDTRVLSLDSLPRNPSRDVMRKTERLEAQCDRTPSDTPGDVLVEIAELENRMLLFRCRDAVVAHLNSLKRCAQLKTVHGSLATTGLSRQISEFTESAVTDQLRARLVEELRALGGDHIPVRIATKEPKGRPGYLCN